MTAPLIILALLALLILAAYAIVALVRWGLSLRRQLALADEQLAAKDRRIDLLVGEQAQLNGRHEHLQHCINAYITSIPKANKTHARRLAAERCMN